MFGKHFYKLLGIDTGEQITMTFLLPLLSAYLALKFTN